MKTLNKKLSSAIHLPIAWTDEDWSKPLAIRSPARACAPLAYAAARGKLTHRCADHRARRAFTLIELLVVIAIIALLAALIFPVYATVTKRAKIKAALTDMKIITAAVATYQSTYTLAPLPKPNPYNPPAGQDFSFSETNSDITAILMDQDRFANAGHQRNPQKQSVLTAKFAPGRPVNAVSSDDLNFRDPWGNPYIIAFDLDYDNKVDVTGGDPVFGANYPYRNIPGAVIVWSKGPDGQAGNGNDPVDKDNIKSWE